MDPYSSYLPANYTQMNDCYNYYPHENALINKWELQFLGLLPHRNVVHYVVLAKSCYIVQCQLDLPL